MTGVYICCKSADIALQGAMSLSRDDEQKMRVSAVLVLLAIAGANIASAQIVSQGTLCHIILPTITAV